MEQKWNLHSVGEVVKRASIRLAERDGKDPHAPLNGSTTRVVWQAYVYEVERHLLIADARDEVLRELKAGAPIDIDS